MGRNLDALLGGASRERKQNQSAEITGSEKAGKADENELSGNVDADETLSLSDSENESVSDRELASELESIERDTEISGQAANSVDGTQNLQSSATFAEPSDGADAHPNESHPTDTLRLIATDQIRRGMYQPRRLFDQTLLQELADSIKAQGMIQPILVRPFAGAFELVAGERRWRAAQLAGLTELPAIVREMPDQSVAAVALIENIQRKDLNPLEEAAAFERLCDEFGMTHKSVAESVGRSRASVSNLMRLLDLHDEVKVLVDRGELEMGHARAILGAPIDQQFEIAQQVIKNGMTVRAVEKRVRELSEPTAEKKISEKQTVIDPDIERLSQKLGETLGAAVRIQHKKNGAGTLEVSYSSVSELQGILAHIK